MAYTPEAEHGKPENAQLEKGTSSSKPSLFQVPAVNLQGGCSQPRCFGPPKTQKLWTGMFFVGEIKKPCMGTTPNGGNKY